MRIAVLYHEQAFSVAHISFYFRGRSESTQAAADKMRELLLTAEQTDDGITALDFLKARGFSRRMITALKQSGGGSCCP